MYKKLFLYFTIIYNCIIQPAALPQQLPQNITEQNQLKEDHSLPIIPISPIAQLRTFNLIIINDAYEKSLFNSMTYPWEYPNNAVETEELAQALHENQLVLCHISAWQNIQKVARIWEKFAQTPEKDLTQPFYSLIGNRTFAQKYSKLIKNQNDYLNSLDYLEIIPKLTYPPSSEQTFQSLSSIYSCYRKIVSLQYDCRIINNEFLLFIPRKLILNNQDFEPKIELLPSNPHPLFKTLHQQLQYLIQTKNIDIKKEYFAKLQIFDTEYSLQDIYLGIKYTNLPQYNYQSLDETNNIQTLTTLESIGANLLNTLPNLFIDKNSLKSEYKIFEFLFMPTFNILLMGHGDTDTYIAEITIKKENLAIAETEHINRTSDFIKTLKFFQQSILCNVLTILSCYSAGSKLKDAFVISSKHSNSILESLKYTILITGIMLTPVTTKSIVKYHKYQNFFKNLTFSQQTYEDFQQQQLFKKESIMRQKIELEEDSLYQEELPKSSLESSYESSDIDSEEEKEEKQYPYISALRNLASGERLENHGLIKYKNSAYFVPIESEHTNISRTHSVTQPKIISKKNIILESNQVHSSIVITSENQRIAPGVPQNSYYMIDSINYTPYEKHAETISYHQGSNYSYRPELLTTIIRNIFFPSNITIAEPTYILVKQLQYRGMTLEKNIIIFMHALSELSLLKNPLSGYITSSKVKSSSLFASKEIWLYPYYSWYSSQLMPNKPTKDYLDTILRNNLENEIITRSGQSSPNFSIPTYAPSKKFGSAESLEFIKELEDTLKSRSSSHNSPFTSKQQLNDSEED